MPEKIFYTDSGKGGVLVLLHGFCETHQVWEDSIKEYSKHFSVLAFDLPGVGKSAGLKEGFKISDVASSILKVLAALKIKKVVMAGHSLGGYVTLAAVEKQPELFAGFALFHSTSLADSSEKKESRNKVIEFVETHGAEAFIRPFIPPLFYNKQHPAIERLTKIALDGTPRQTLIGYTRAMRDRPEWSNVISLFNKPILFIAGQRDTIIPVESIHNQAKTAEKGEVRTLPEVVHMGMFEAPQLTTQLIINFTHRCYSSL
ncbi:MAG: alpha/beta hydrolase [Flammeovirgaceae bacterium]|nr:alpha/beta hydrolase [Flammeovirgaceae bacterium]